MTRSRSSQQGDLLSLVESAYHEVSSEREWFDNLLSAAHVVGRGGSVFAQSYVVGPNGVVITGSPGRLGAMLPYMDPVLAMTTAS